MQNDEKLKVKDLFLTNQWEELVDYCESMEIDDPEVSFCLSQAYYFLEQYDKAKIEADRFFLTYIEKQSAFSYYIDLLIKQNNWILAYKLAFKYQEFKQITKIKQAEEDYIFNNAEFITKKAQQFSNINAFAYNDAIELYQKAQQLPLTDYLKAAKYILMNPFLNQLIRVDLIADLEALNVNEEIKYIWLDEKIAQINPVVAQSKKLLFQEKLADALKVKEASLDPVLFEQLKEQVLFHFELIHPQEEKIKDIYGYLDLIISAFYGHDILDLQQEQDQIYLKITDLFTNLLINSK